MYPLALTRCKEYYASGNIGRSLWPRGLRYERSSPAQTLGSWVWIPFEAWMSVSVSCMFVSSCVGNGLSTELITRPRGLWDPQFQIYSDGKQASWPNTKGRVRRRRRRRRRKRRRGRGGNTEVTELYSSFNRKLANMARDTFYFDKWWLWNQI
jgi:hypothetical protein